MAAELTVEVWDVGGSQNTKQLEALSKDPGKVISNSRFLGVVEIPLATTLHYNRGAVAPEPRGSCPWCLNSTARPASSALLKHAGRADLAARRPEGACMGAAVEHLRSCFTANSELQKPFQPLL